MALETPSLHADSRIPASAPARLGRRLASLHCINIGSLVLAGRKRQPAKLLAAGAESSSIKLESMSDLAYQLSWGGLYYSYVTALSCAMKTPCRNLKRKQWKRKENYTVGGRLLWNEATEVTSARCSGGPAQTIIPPAGSDTWECLRLYWSTTGRTSKAPGLRRRTLILIYPHRK